MAQVYGGRWTVVRDLPEGGQAWTYLVNDRDADDPARLFVLKRWKAKDRPERFHMEAERLKRIRSDHVPPIIDKGVDKKGYPYLVTPYVGQNLEDPEMRDAPLAEVLQRLRGVATALRDAHAKSIAHRDLKPNNVCVDADGRAYLVDWALSLDTSAPSGITATSEALGNVAFAAPECQPGHPETSSPASDMYSVGKLIFWMVGGGYIHREAFDDNQIALMQIDDPWARSYCARLIHKTVVETPGQRWTAPELLQAIDWIEVKLQEHQARREAGEVVIWDGLGVGGAYNAGGQNSATTLPHGNPPADQDLAEAFLVLGDTDALLDRVELVVRVAGGTGRRLEVQVCSDTDGAPDPALVRESFTVEIDSYGPRTVVLESRLRPRLEAGTPYWVVLSVPDPDSNIAWLSGTPELWRMPVRVRRAERYDGGPWHPQGIRNGPGSALLVTGLPL